MLTSSGMTALLFSILGESVLCNARSNGEIQSRYILCTVQHVTVWTQGEGEARQQARDGGLVIVVCFGEPLSYKGVG